MDLPPFGEHSGAQGGPSPLRPYAVQPELSDSIFDIPLRPVSAPSRPTTARIVHAAPPTTTRLDDAEASSFLRGVTAAGMIGFASTALVMPFDVGKTLLQVQWIPREEVSLAELEPEETGEEDEEGSDEEQAESYFDDLATRPRSAPLDSAALQRMRQRPSPRDHAGYLKRQSVFDEATRPEHVLPVVVTGGVWEMVKALTRSKTEGFTSLWKGQMTTFIIDTLETLIRPFFSLFLTSTLAPTMAGLSLLESPRPGFSLLLEVAARLSTSFLLSPLDLIRTRLIVQSAAPRFRKYRGPMHALRSILEEEGGLRSIYLHANLVLPTILDATVRSLLHLSAPLLLERVFKLRSETRPIIFGLAELTINTAGLLVVLPIETVRRRLQLQSRATAVTRGRPLRACVETRPVPYAGIVDALYRIVIEETSTVPEQVAARKGRSRREAPATVGEAKANGLGQLYRGFQVGVAANLLVLVLGLLGEREVTL